MLPSLRTFTFSFSLLFTARSSLVMSMLPAEYVTLFAFPSRIDAISSLVKVWMIAATSFMFFPSLEPSALKFAFAEYETSSVSSLSIWTSFTFSSSFMISMLFSRICLSSAFLSTMKKDARGWRILRFELLLRARPIVIVCITRLISLSSASSRSSLLYSGQYERWMERGMSSVLRFW